MISGALVALELATGTFYLLMIALGAAAGGILSWAGASNFIQITVAGVVAAAAVLAFRRSKWARPSSVRALSNPDVNPDIGQSLQIDTWSERRARATYRGAMWDVELAGQSEPVSGRFTIVEVRGNLLIVDNVSAVAPPASNEGEMSASSVS